MSKMYAIIALGLAVQMSFAAVDAQNIRVPVAGATTNSVTGSSIRGIVEAIKIVVPANATGTVTVADSGTGQTLFNKELSESATYPVRVPVYTTAGAAHTLISTATNAVLDRAAIIGNITAKVVQSSATTNTWAIKIIYSK